jgi:hypothetical protein
MLRGMLIRLVLAACLIASSALAQDSLIDRGVTLREQGDDAGALELFRQAYDSTHSAHALAQMALAEQALGRWVDAYGHLTQALAGDDEWVASHREPLETALEVIRGHVGRIDLSGGVDGASIVIDGHTVGTFPLREPIAVTPGRVNLEVHAEGYAPAVREIEVAAGALAREAIAMEQETTPAPVTAAGGESISPIGPVLLGVAGALAVGGLITAIVTLDHDSQLSALCPANNCDPSARGVLSERRAFAITTDVLFISSAIAAGTGLVLTFVLRDRAPPPVTAGCGPTGCGVVIQGAWQ